MNELPISSGVEEPHLHPRHTGRRGLDLVLALCAIAISVISLFVALEHGRTERQLVAASTWPILVFQEEHRGDGANGHDEVSYRIKNAGIGPANIVWARVLVDGVEVRDLAALVQRCCGARISGYVEGGRLGLTSNNSLTGVLDPRDSTTLLSWSQKDAPPAVWTSVERLGRRLSFDACYCSALDECWRSTVRTTRQPRRVQGCDPVPDGYTSEED